MNQLKELSYSGSSNATDMVNIFKTIKIIIHYKIVYRTTQ